MVIEMSRIIGAFKYFVIEKEYVYIILTFD